MFNFAKQIIYMLIIVFIFSITQTPLASVLSSDATHNAAIQADNTIVYWGDGNQKFTPPSGTFLQISVGKNHLCAIQTHKTVICWGIDINGETISPNGSFSQISAGVGHTCGIHMNGNAVCWGKNDQGQASPPKGNFLQVSAGEGFTCGIQADDTINCWGEMIENDTHGPTIPSGSFTQISAGWRHGCGVKTDNTAICWGSNSDCQSIVPNGLEPNVAHINTCGPYDVRGSELPVSLFLQISGSRFHTCGVRIDGTAACWGFNRNGPATPPKGTFVQMSSGRYHTCGLRPNNTVECWGKDHRYSDAVPAAYTMVPKGLIVKSAEPTCLLYGVHNSQKNTQFFIINTGSTSRLEVNPRGELDKNYSIQAVDIHPQTNQLFAVSTIEIRRQLKSRLYKVANGAQELIQFGDIDIKNIQSLTFNPDGTLWGWAPAEGLFRIDENDNHEPDLATIETVISDEGSVEIEDITWDENGSLLYGIENLKQGGIRLWRYSYDNNIIDTICNDEMATLKAEFTGIDTLSDNLLLLGFRQANNLIFDVFDIQSCEHIVQEQVSTPYNEVKGFAWPDCSHPYVDIPS